MKNFGEEIVVLDKFVPGGQVFATLADGRKVFVWGALPHETAKIRIFKTKKSYAEAVATEILTPSPERVEPRDDCYLATSPWQILDFAAENRAKSDLVRDAFAQEKIELENSREIATDDRAYFYRNKMEYSLWWQDFADAPANLRGEFSAAETRRGGKIFLAFHRRGSHQKIPIVQSSIELPAIFAAAQTIVAQLNSQKSEARNYQSLLIRANQNGEVSSALFENNRSHPTMKNLRDTILGSEFSYSPNGFFQINLPVYELALDEISRNLGDAKKVVDLYAGVGTIGLSVARDRELILIETDKNAFREMTNNIPRGAKNIRGICAKSEDSLEFIAPDATVIVNPPRAGLDQKVVAKILAARPRKVIYLSCNPATQARDVAKLLAKYQIISQQAFNFFPRTPHIENLVVLGAI